MLCTECKNFQVSPEHGAICKAKETHHHDKPSEIRTARIVFCNDEQKEPQFWQAK